MRRGNYECTRLLVGYQIIISDSFYRFCRKNYRYRSSPSSQVDYIMVTNNNLLVKVCPQCAQFTFSFPRAFRLRSLLPRLAKEADEAISTRLAIILLVNASLLIYFWQHTGIIFLQRLFFKTHLHFRFFCVFMLCLPFSLLILISVLTLSFLTCFPISD